MNNDGYIEFTYRHRDKVNKLKIYTLKPIIGSTGQYPRMVLYDSLSTDNGLIHLTVSEKISLEQSICPMTNVILSYNENLPRLSYATSNKEFTGSIDITSFTLWSVDFSRPQIMSTFSSITSWKDINNSEVINSEGTEIVSSGIKRELIDGIAEGDKDLKITFENGTWLALRGTSHLDSTVINRDAETAMEDVERIRADLKCKLPVDPGNPNSWIYRGNVQISIGSHWIGQFELNATGTENVILDDNYYHATFSFVLPDVVTQKIKNGSAEICLYLSAVNRDEEFILEQIEFHDADQESGRDWKNFIKENTEYKDIKLTDIPTWQQYIDAHQREGEYPGGPLDLYKDFPELSSKTIVKHDYGEKVGIFITRQDSDYPMLFVESWAIQEAYEPVSETSPWRQCWMLVGFTGQL